MCYNKYNSKSYNSFYTIHQKRVISKKYLPEQLKNKDGLFKVRVIIYYLFFIYILITVKDATKKCRTFIENTQVKMQKNVVTFTPENKNTERKKVEMTEKFIYC